MSICWHRWAKWKDIAKYEIVPVWSSSQGPCNFELHQERRCEKCGRVQWRMEKAR